MEADPLGAVPSVINNSSLQRWHCTAVPEYDMIVDNPEGKKQSPFTYDKSINQKIVLWCGDITLLDAEAIVHSTNESFSDRNTDSERLMASAGAGLRKEIKQNLRTCRTGEAKMTKGYRLPARYILHTVGPRYNVRYQTAAESALFNCYRNIMQIVMENHIASVAIPCVHSSRRGYPAHEGGHIAIRAIRRFLEKHGDGIDSVIFVASENEELDVYNSLLPLYFPRTKSEEEFAAYHLPDDIGNENGEPVIRERQIRILGKPTHEAKKNNWESPEDLEESVNINEAFNTSVAVGAHSFSKMHGDVDKKKKLRLQYETHIALQNKEQYKRYERWLRRSQQEDLVPIESLRCLYQSGFDKFGRPIIVFIGCNFPAMKVDLDKFTLYLINLMDNLVSKQFVFVYFHTMTNADNHPDTDYVRSLYNLLDNRYKQNLGALYIVHPTFWSKIMTWVFTTFNIAELKPRVQSIRGLEYLYSRIPMDQLDIPSFITDYDIKVNGTRYYNPDEDASIGAL